MASQKSRTQPFAEDAEDVVSELITAVQSGEYSLVKSILEGKSHNFAVRDIVNTVKTTTDGQTTALFEACTPRPCHKPGEEENFISMMERLLDNWADPDFPFEGVAVEEESLSMVKLLLDHGADPDIAVEDAFALHTTVRRGDLTLLRLLLEGNASANQTDGTGKSALHLCCNTQNHMHPGLEILTTLIKYKADVNLQDKSGSTPLHYSCVKKRPDLSKALLQNEALTTIQDNSGNSPLHLAICERDLISARTILVASKASVNLTNNNGQSALHLCCENIKNGIGLYTQFIHDLENETRIHDYESETGILDVVKDLLDNGASTTIPDNRGNTPLHLAVKQSSLRLIKLFISEFSVNQTNDDGQSALHLCCYNTRSPTQNLEILTTLISHGADINLQDKNGRTPLHLSCERESDYLTMTLVEEGALVSIQDHTGISPLHVAIEKGKVLSMLHSVHPRSLKPNENIELIIEAYEVTALSTSGSEPFECMHKATELREEHNIKKITLEPMECYGFAKEWETIEELEACRGDEKQLKLQATLAGERIYQGKNESLVELKYLINNHLISDVLEASKSDAGKLLEHHLDIRVSQLRDRHSLVLLEAWKKIIQADFKLFDTNTVVRFARVTIEILQFEARSTDSPSVETHLSFVAYLPFVTFVLIMRLYRRNRRVEGASQNEQSLAKALLRELIDAVPVVPTPYGEGKLLQHWLTSINFIHPHTHFLSRTQYDWDLMKMLLESGLQINEVDFQGNTILHCALNSIRADCREAWVHRRFNQEFIDQSVESITLMLEKGVYPNARNKEYETARDLLDLLAINTAMGQKISDVLKHYEHQYAMTLKHKAAAVVKESGLPYEDSLPEELANFVNLQGDKPRDVYFGMMIILIYAVTMMSIVPLGHIIMMMMVIV